MNRPRNLPNVRLAACILPLGLAWTVTARGGVVESNASYESQGKTIAVERFEPEEPGKYPAVLVLHGAGGMRVGGPAFREYARLLARREYVAHVVHYFDLTGTETSDPEANKAHFAAWMRAIADGVTNASAQPNVDPARIGLLGFSLGAYLSLSVATLDRRVSAVVDYFGGLPEALARDLKAMPPVLILHGDADRVVPVREAHDLERRLKAEGLAYEVHIYPGQGHGFTGDDQRDAVNRTLEFLDRHVKKAGPR